MLLSGPSPFHAGFTPRPVWKVRRPVLLDLLCRRLSRLRRQADWCTLFLLMLLELYDLPLALRGVSIEQWAEILWRLVFAPFR